MIDWGDGTKSAGTVTQPTAANGFHGTVTGSHVYDLHGTVTLSITITDQHGVSGSATVSTTISEDPVVGTPVPVAGKTNATLTAPVAVFTHDDNTEPAAGFDVTIDWGDHTTSTGKVVLLPQLRRYVIFGGHKYTRAGTYKLNVTIDDDGTDVVIHSSAIILGGPSEARDRRPA
jgi:hypothetical protein